MGEINKCGEIESDDIPIPKVVIMGESITSYIVNFKALKRKGLFERLYFRSKKNIMLVSRLKRTTK